MANMHFLHANFVTYSIKPAKVLIDRQTSRIIGVYLVERDTLFGQKSLDDASIWIRPATNISFHHPIHPFIGHHAVQKCWPKIGDIFRDMNQQMHHDIKECGWKVYL